MKNMINMNLQLLRKQHQYTQEEVAEKIAVSRQAVAKWENGESLPDMNKCIALAQLYQISLDTLVNGSETAGLPLPPRGKHVFGTVTVGERGQIVIPKKAREIFQISPGDSLLILGDENQGGLALIDANQFINQFEFVKQSLDYSHKASKDKESED
ncbi:helix-turn-helix domain-containing protein [Acetobacterium fimetarium]|uniref:Helix-turn-helix domain-containing protein n=1 Tax=Acetobacterium fimetarium TaxID=52691 RepID=A0ABR6WZH0_9FIRM|nr:helix-turn-helix domain-containing protein [Acetobacterium fimetarium]MBC3805559.1 helix-turn-helix domain-containing protein [Acetobacterium fimetarium]